MYSFTSRVRYSECDEQGRLTLVAMVNYLQDCSTFQSEDLGLGVTGIDGKGYAWALVGWHIEVDDLPRFGDTITVSTFAYDMTRVMASRCFQIVDANGRSLVRADSRWVLFDHETGRTVRIPESQLAYLEDRDRIEMGAFERKIRVPEGGTPCAEVTVTEHNLDTNHHVNNAQYLLFALDALEGLGESVELVSFSILYHRMAWLGDVLTPVAHKVEDGWIIEIVGSNDASYSTVRIHEGACVH